MVRMKSIAVRCHMRRLRDQRGFTLLEVMIALVILAVGLLGLASLQIMAIKGNSYGQQMTVASTLAQNQLEQLRRTAGALTAGGDTVTDQNGITYARNWAVQVNQPQQGMTIVVITISWTGPTGQGGEADRSINIRTII
ncbi:MAG: type IV pilus modification protein PilV [Desulfobacterales bacterium]|nr:type IV pilus modification protein PilV [Desulfobacterales bacterium]